MIVVRANLYRCEARGDQRLSPKARVAWIAGLLLCAGLLADIAESRGVAALRGQARAAEAHAAELARDLKAAQAADAELGGSIAQRDVILAHARRHNWAPVLAEICAAVSPTAELSTLRIAAESPEKTVVRILGKCTSAQPRIDADKCLLQITHAFATAGYPMTGRFVSLEDVPSALIGDVNAGAKFIFEFKIQRSSHANN